MKKMLVGILLVMIGLVSLKGLNTNACAPGSLMKIRCTCYTDSGITASGEVTRDGIMAGKREWLGKVAALYRYNADGSVGEFIGYYEFLDTGAGIDTDGDGRGDSIKKGLSVDVWKETDAEVKDWIAEYGDYVYIEIIDAEG